MRSNTFLAALIRILENKQLTGLERHELLKTVVYFYLEQEGVVA